MFNMNNKYTIIVIIIGLISCKDNNNNEFIGNKQDITSSSMSWLNYQWNYIEWHNNYIAYNTKGEVISKIEFLKQLCTGSKIPMRLNKANEVAYMLQDLNLKRKVEREIGEGVASTCFYQLKLAEMEGRKLPDFNWTPINGEKITNAALINDTLILNTWFLNCLPCKQEIPDLNKLTEKFKNRPNVKFFALSLDPRDSVERFLNKTPFKYVQIPEQEEYLRIKLGIMSYPNHIVIINDTIIKALNKPNHLEEYLKLIIRK